MKTTKKGVSLIVSYVLLVVITISLSLGVYTWIKIQSNITPTPECPDSSSLIIKNYNCQTGQIELIFENKGRFNLEGFYLRGTGVSDGEAVWPLNGLEGNDDVQSFGTGTGAFLFSPTIEPNQERVGFFSYPGEWGSIKKISLEPFRFYEEQVILCENADITVKIDC